jgi:hypothetical protein
MWDGPVSLWGSWQVPQVTVPLRNHSECVDNTRAPAEATIFEESLAGEISEG